MNYRLFSHRLRVLLFPAAILCIVFVSSSPPVQAQQKTAFDYLSQALVNVISYSTVVNLLDYDYLSTGSSVFGVYLRSGQEHRLRISLTRGTEYVILGSGDEDIEDLDLWIIDEGSQQVVARDNDRDANPVLAFTAPTTGPYVITVRNYRSRAPSFCAMVILEKSGKGDFSLAELAEAVQNVMRLSRTAGLFAVGFAENAFCLFGGRVANGASNTLFDYSLSGGRYIAVGAGSNNVRDADLFIHEQHRQGNSAGREIAKDVDRDNTPVCIFEAQAGRHYAVTYRNHESAGTSGGFVFAVLLRMQQ